MRRHRSRLAILPNADAVTYCATTLEESALLQLLDIWPPGIVVADGVVVHQKDVLGHFDLPIPRQCGASAPQEIAWPISVANSGSMPPLRCSKATGVPRLADTGPSAATASRRCILLALESTLGAKAVPGMPHVGRVNAWHRRRATF